MKKIFTLLSIVCSLMVANRSFGQTLSVHEDTVVISSSGAISVENTITNSGAAADTIQWKIASSTMPADWMASVTVCDNFNCYGNADLWPTVIKDAIYPVGTGTFHVTMDVTSVVGVGPYVMRIRINNKFNANDTAWQTYIVSKIPASTFSPKLGNDISLYPNPAVNSINVVYDAASDIKNIAIYNIIGKQMSAYRVTSNVSASLNLENIPSGIYFVRLLNSHGDVVTTRKFTKQ